MRSIDSVRNADFEPTRKSCFWAIRTFDPWRKRSEIPYALPAFRLEHKAIGDLLLHTL